MFNINNIKGIKVNKFIVNNILNEILPGRYSTSADNNTIRFIDLTSINGDLGDFLSNYTIEYDGNLDNGVLFNLGKQNSNNIDLLNKIIVNSDSTNINSIYSNLIYFLSSIFYNNINLSQYYLFCEPHDIGNIFIYNRKSPSYIKIKNTYNNQYGNIHEIDIYSWFLNSITNNNDYILKGNYREYILGTSSLKIFLIRSGLLNNTAMESIRTTIKNNISNSYIYENIYTPGGFLVYINGEEYLIQINVMDNIYLYYNVLDTLNFFKKNLPNILFDFKPISIIEYSTSETFNRSFNSTNNFIHFLYSRNKYIIKYLNKKINNTDTNNRITYYYSNSSINNNDIDIIRVINPVTREEEFYNITDSTFINNLGITMGNYLLSVCGFDFSSKKPIQLSISKEYSIGNTYFQDIKYIIGGSIPINNDELLFPKSQDYTNLFTLTVVNPPINSTSYNYGRNFIEVHKYIRNLGYNYSNQSLVASNKIIFKPKQYNSNIEFYNNIIIFPIQLSIGLFNCITNSDTTNYFNNNFFTNNNISNTYYTIFGYKYDNTGLGINLYFNDMFSNANLYIPYIKGYFNTTLALNDFKNIIYDNFIETIYNIFKNKYIVDYSNFYLDTTIYKFNNFLNNSNILDTIYIPSEGEISLYIDGTDVLSNKGKHIVISQGQKQNDINNLFEYERDSVYVRDGTSIQSLLEYFDSFNKDKIYFVIGLNINHITNVYKIYNFLYNIQTIRNYYSTSSSYNNSNFNNLFNLYMNDYFSYDIIPVIFEYNKNDVNIKILYPGLRDFTFHLDSTNSYSFENTIVISKYVFSSDRYQFINDMTGIYMYILDPDEITNIIEIQKNLKNINSNIYYSELGFFIDTYIPNKYIKNKMGVYIIND